MSQISIDFTVTNRDIYYYFFFIIDTNLKEEKRTTKENLYKLGKKLGLAKKDFDDILKYTGSRKEQSSLSIGPTWYPSTKYGTISINDF